MIVGSWAYKVEIDKGFVGESHIIGERRVFNKKMDAETHFEILRGIATGDERVVLFEYDKESHHYRKIKVGLPKKIPSL